MDLFLYPNNNSMLYSITITIKALAYDQGWWRREAIHHICISEHSIKTSHNWI